jgi:hypothetical protein
MPMPETCLCGGNVCQRCFPGLAGRPPCAPRRAHLDPEAQRQAEALARALDETVRQKDDA